MYAYVVPKDERGKLNCRAFYGARDALSTMQSDFAEQVGVKHGLERGLEGSRARHTSIREYYGRVNAEMPAKTPQIDLPPTKLLEGKEAYGERVAAAVLQQIGPELKILRAKAGERDAAVKQQREAERIAKRESAASAKQSALVAELAKRSNDLKDVVGLFRESEIKQAIARRLRQEEERRAAPAKEPEREPEMRQAQPKGRDLER